MAGALALLATACPAADPGPAAALLPPAANVVETIARSPAYRAALRLVDAESAVQTQLRVGPHEWVGTVSAARRAQRTPTSESTGEWDLGLERGLRLPGKAAAADAAGRARVAQAQAQRRKAWREQARTLLDRHGQWLREREAARVWAEQVVVLAQQRDAVTRRQRLGDAARIELQMAEAALVQAQAQAQAAGSRAAAAHAGLQQEFQGLDLSGPFEVTAPPAVQPAEAWIEAQRKANPELELARRDWAMAESQTQLDRAEQHPDPTVGVRVGQARNGGERFVGVVLSLPFGGDYRAAGTAASAARASAAALRLQDAERRATTEAAQRLREAQAAQALWAGNADAAQRLSQVADGLQRSYQLGEAGLGEVVAARRLANEQHLAAATGAVDAWMAHHRLALDAERLWAEAP